MAKNGCGTLKNKDKNFFVVEYNVFVYWNVLEVVFSIENYVCKRSIDIPISFFKLPHLLLQDASSCSAAFSSPPYGSLNYNNLES